MRHLTSLVFFAAGLISAADVKVIANQSVKATQVSTDELKRIFLGTDTSLEGGNVVPVFEKGGATHEAFLKQYLGRSSPAKPSCRRCSALTRKWWPMWRKPRMPSVT